MYLILVLLTLISGVAFWSLGVLNVIVIVALLVESVGIHSFPTLSLGLLVVTVTLWGVSLIITSILSALALGLE